MEYKDQIGRTVTVPKIPSRIISLVPSQTELLVDLGLRDKIVGITKFCVHPKELRQEISVVGGTKKIHLNKIAALNPDFILCNKEENSLEMVQELEKIAPVWVTDMFNVEDCKEMILQLGKVFQNGKAQNIVANIENAYQDFKIFMEDKEPLSVLYLIWKSPYMAAGRNTFINYLLQLNYFKNAILEENSRYPEITEEELIKADTILLSTEPYPFKEEDALALKEQIGKEVIVVDGEYFSWYGSRLIKAFDYFKTLH